MPESIRKMFSKTSDITINIEEEFKKGVSENLRSKEVLEKSIQQHALMCVDNSEDLKEAKIEHFEIDVKSKNPLTIFLNIKKIENVSKEDLEHFFQSLLYTY
mgnify:CR=1 FL=1